MKASYVAVSLFTAFLFCLSNKGALAQQYECQTDVLQVIDEGSFGGIRVRDSLIYCVSADPVRQFRIYDVSDLSQVALVGAYDIDAGGSFALYENYALVCTQSDGVKILDISNPSNIQQVSGFAEGRPCFEVRVSGTTAILRDGGRWLHLIDISNPVSPSLRLITHGSAVQVSSFAAQGDYLYVYCDRPYNEAVRIYDIRPGIIPMMLKEIAVDDSYSGIRSVADKFVLLRRDDNSDNRILEIYNLHDPLVPAYIGQLNLPGDFGGLWNVGDLVAIRIDGLGRAVYTLDKQGLLDLVGISNSVGAGGATFYGELLLTASEGGMLLVDPAVSSSYEIKNKFNYDPQIASFVPLTQVENDVWAFVGNYMFITELNGSDDPNVLSGNIVPSVRDRIYASGNNAISRNHPQWDVFDISEPLSAQYMGSIGSAAGDAAIENNRIVAPSEEYTARYDVYEIVDNQLSLLYAYDYYDGSVTGPVQCVMHDGVVYAAMNRPELHIFDVSGNDGVQVISVTESLFQSPDLMKYKNGYLYASRDDLLTIVDVRDPASPVVVNTLHVEGHVVDFAFGNQYLFMTVGKQEYAVYDIANLSEPRQIARRAVPFFSLTNFGVSRVFVDQAQSTGYIFYAESTHTEILMIDLTTGCQLTCLPDTNNDGTLSPADFSAWVAAFNTQAPACDQNDDGSCTPADFSAWVANYNAGCP